MTFSSATMAVAGLSVVIAAKPAADVMNFLLLGVFMEFARYGTNLAFFFNKANAGLTPADPGINTPAPV